MFSNGARTRWGLDLIERGGKRGYLRQRILAEAAHGLTPAVGEKVPRVAGVT